MNWERFQHSALVGSMVETQPEPESGDPMTTPPKRRPTLDEVAALAGVSRSAASRAINGSGHASRATREAVERAVRELGYVPNPTARALATQQSGAVVLAVSHHDSELFADPF